MHMYMYKQHFKQLCSPQGLTYRKQHAFQILVVTLHAFMKI